MWPSDSRPAEDSDTVLLTRARAGDAAAFEALVRRYHPELFAFAARRLHDPSAADDILQDVFLAVWQRRQLIANDTPLRAYLYRAVRNAIANIRRNSLRTEQTLESEALYGPHLDPLMSLERREVLDAIERAITELPDRCREAWILVRERNLSYAEAAHVLGVSPGTVHTQVSRAFAAIRRAVAPFLVVAVALVR